ncbi:MAG: hypothetical protein KDJ26_07345 [Alphaproteobacteria bacterium]|nr:hypothetical protein [Alphaproteobacteria bacterium]
MNMALFSSAVAELGSRHTRFGGLGRNDMGRTIQDEDGVKGIYFGTVPVLFHNDGRKSYNLYAAVSDVRDERGNRLRLTFREHAERLCCDPDGEKNIRFSYSSPKSGLRRSYNRAVGSYKEALLDRLDELSPGERTGLVIPMCDFLFVPQSGGQRFSAPHDLFSSREKGDFIESNGSLLVLKDTRNGRALYLACDGKNKDFPDTVDFSSGRVTKTNVPVLLRPVVVERCLEL